MVDIVKDCPACGGKVATSAKACPHCGAVQKKKTSLFTWIMAGFFAMMLLLVIGATNQRQSAATCPPINPASITLRGPHADAQADFTAKAQRLNASGICVIEGEFGESHQKFYFAIDKDGNPRNRYFIRLTREELRQ